MLTFYMMVVSMAFALFLLSFLVAIHARQAATWRAACKFFALVLSANTLAFTWMIAGFVEWANIRVESYAYGAGTVLAFAFVAGLLKTILVDVRTTFDDLDRGGPRGVVRIPPKKGA